MFGCTDKEHKQFSKFAIRFCLKIAPLLGAGLTCTPQSGTNTTDSNPNPYTSEGTPSRPSRKDGNTSPAGVISTDPNSGGDGGSAGASNGDKAAEGSGNSTGAILGARTGSAGASASSPYSCPDTPDGHRGYEAGQGYCIGTSSRQACGAAGGKPSWQAEVRCDANLICQEHDKIAICVSATAGAGTPGAGANGASTNTVQSPVDITQPGIYTLSNDIAIHVPSSYNTNNPPRKIVLYVHDTNDVHIDCGHHNLTLYDPGDGVIVVENVSNFTLSNCNLFNSSLAQAAAGKMVKVYWGGLRIKNSQHGTVSNNEIEFVDVANSNNLMFTGNHIKDTYQQNDSYENVIQNNNFEGTGDNEATSAGCLVSNGGRNNLFANNTLDGKWDGNPNTYSKLGADDGIILSEESDSAVIGNIVKNTWDCGIETSGQINRVTFAQNTITNSTNCAIGAWYWNSWKGNIVIGNTADKTGPLFALYRVYGMRSKSFFKYLQQDDTAVNFQDNLFANNSQTSASPVGPSRITFAFQDLQDNMTNAKGLQAITQADLQLGNNVFIHNTFAGGTPELSPSSMFLDGGGNLCSAAISSGFPLVCSKP